MSKTNYEEIDAKIFAEIAAAGEILKPTLGPWHVVVKPQKFSIESSLESNGWSRTVAEVARDASDSCAANARLIAAAPDMLSTLKMALDCLNDIYSRAKPGVNVGMYDPRENIKAAIAKAEGRPLC